MMMMMMITTTMIHETRIAEGQFDASLAARILFVLDREHI